MVLKTVTTLGGGGGGNGGGTVTNVATGTGLTGGPITTIGTISIANTAVNVGTYGDTTHVGQFTVNQQGQLTQAANVAIAYPADQTVTNVDGTITVSPSNGVGNVVISANLANAMSFTGNISYTNITVAGKATVNITEVNNITIDNTITFINTPVIQTNALIIPSGNMLLGNATNTATATPDIKDIICIMDGGGSNIGANVFVDEFIDFNCTITQVTVLGQPAVVGGNGNIVINIATCTYAQYDAGNTHPNIVADSITSNHTPTLSSNVKYQDSTLTGWTTSITAGTVLRFGVVNAAANITKVSTTLKVNRIL